MRSGTLTELSPLELLYDRAAGEDLPLGDELERLHGRLAFPRPRRRPYVISNFVHSLDGVAALGIPNTSGGQISGHNEHDRMVMGLLRAVAGAVVVGAGTARSVPKHLWTSGYVYAALESEYAELRKKLGIADLPLNVIVTARGEIDTSQRVFQGEVPVLVLTTEAGARRLSEEGSIESSRVRPVAESGKVAPTAVLEVLREVVDPEFVLLEGGPHLMADFFDEELVDELFLTQSPLLAGRNGHKRPGFVAGREFAPDAPLWGEVVSVRRADSHLFLRYAFRNSKKQEHESVQKEV
jgi:riboflavin biosynthesis pyrimidine reductase